MSAQAAVQTQTAAKPSITPVTSSVLRRQCACGQHANGGECAECGQKRGGTLQRAAINASPVHDAPPIVHEVLRSPGQPLDANSRAFMELRFGHDFSGVRVHTDAQAVEAARAVSALAYTAGRSVVFGAGQYAPHTSIGRRLLAHELSHVVQQASGSPTTLGVSNLFVVASNAQSEREAAAVSNTFTESGSPLSYMLTPVSSPVLQRQVGAGAVAGLVLSTIGVGKSFMPPSEGGLSYSSGQITYHEELGRIGVRLKNKTPLAAVFWSNRLTGDCRTTFCLHGDFSDSNEPATASNRVMANVFIALDKTTTYPYSKLSFTAVPLEHAYGEAQDPRIRFKCEGWFDPLGSGEAGYFAVLEVDQHANVNCVEFRLTNGEAIHYENTNQGIEIEIRGKDGGGVYQDPVQEFLLEQAISLGTMISR
jgi:hypothetical protein